MIRKLRIKYIALSLSALFLLLSIIVAGMNAFSYGAVVDEADETLSILSKYSGVFPDMSNGMEWLPSGMSRETPFESRYFSVLLDSNNDPILMETSNIYAIDGQTAAEYAKEVAEDNKESGFKGEYRFIASSETVGKRITFLDCGRKLKLFREFRNTSIFMALSGYLIIAVLVCFFVARFTRPVAESYEKQKRFITDAGHEIKTPLTIINADVDILKMDIEDNEYLEDITKQSKRLAGLTNDLVYLSKMEESQKSLALIEFPVSEVVQDTAESFTALAQTQNKNLLIQVESMLSMNGNSDAITKLVSILLENAIKYSPEGSEVSLSFMGQGHHMTLSVKNTSALPITEDNLRHAFDRFYRADASRNSETGGHGIGLSMAQAIVNAHEGRIGATSPDGSTFIITATLPR